jgi:sarcosine oxidase
LAHADVIVVGLGAMGSAACRALAARGVSVLGIDRYAPPHQFGSTHGDTRITRLAIGEGPEYVPLVRRSHGLWRELERETGTALLTQCGGVVLAPAGSAFLERTRGVARDYEIRHENLGHDALSSRFPMFAIDPRTEGYFEPEAGYVRAEAAVRAQLELAHRGGAELRLGETVESWSAGGEGVRVDTSAGAHRAERLVLCAGPWTPELFPEGRELFAVHRQLMYWFEIERDYAQLRGMPVFVFDFGEEASGFVHLHGFYGFPAVDGERGGLKVATESYAETTTPDGRQHPATQTEIDEMYERCIGSHLPWLGRESLRTVSCLYTNTRGSRFLIDRHPGHDEVVVVSACSGHGFKHSPAIGEAVAQLVIDGTSSIDLFPFSLAAHG